MIQGLYDYMYAFNNQQWQWALRQTGGDPITDITVMDVNGSS